MKDNVNSVRELVTSDGTVLDQITYDSFGSVTNETTPPNGDRFKFTGREWDSEIGAFCYRARYYAPYTAKFISEDPLRFAQSDTNLYRYVRNSPLYALDPTGLYQVSGSQAYYQQEMKEFYRWYPREVARIFEKLREIVAQRYALAQIVRKEYTLYVIGHFTPGPMNNLAYLAASRQELVRLRVLVDLLRRREEETADYYRRLTTFPRP